MRHGNRARVAAGFTPSEVGTPRCGVRSSRRDDPTNAALGPESVATETRVTAHGVNAPLKISRSEPGSSAFAEATARQARESGATALAPVWDAVSS
jgi:hypothetical protein